MRTVHLVDRLDRARVEAPGPSYVEVQEMDCGGAPRPGLFQHPDSEVAFGVGLPFGGRLRGAVGIKRLAWDKLAGPVRFRVGVARGGGVEWVWQTALDPASRPEHRGWVPFSVGLPRGSAVVLATAADDGAHAWAGWADPVLAVRLARGRRPRRRGAGHVVLLTADALRADHVTGGVAHTPNLDRLSAEGVVLEGARTVTASTPASYGSLLTGVHAPRHGVLGEWGTLPNHLPSLPRALGELGFRTVFAPSEDETGRPEQGFSTLFDELLPCVGNPSQDGAITARRIVERLDDAGDERLFVWGQFFDCHPPRRLPDALVGRHYEGDPRDPARTWEPERVAAIRGSEIVLHLDAALPALRAGRVDMRLVYRLRDAARTLAGELAHGPDLAEHLAGLGLADPALPPWLADRADALGRGERPEDLLAWLEDLRPRLRVVEREVIGWLEGVVDYRWPLAQPLAAAAHFDAHVGIVMEALAGSMLIVGSPHGECYGENGVHFSHHAPYEPVLRVPLVVRAPGLEPRRVRGTFELIDLMPSLVTHLGGQVPDGTDGRALPLDRDLPERTSFAVMSDGVAVVATRGARKLVRTLARLPESEPGDQVWLRDDEPGERDPELEADLDAWLSSRAASSLPGAGTATARAAASAPSK